MRGVMRGRAGMAAGLPPRPGDRDGGNGDGGAAHHGQADQGRVGRFARPVEGRPQADRQDGRAGPARAAGHPGPATGAAGGDLTGSYPDPTLRRPAAVVVRQQPGPSCITTFDILCGDAGAGNYWTQAGGASFAQFSYFVEPGGFVQFQGAVQQVGTRVRERPALLPAARAGARAGRSGSRRCTFDDVEDAGHVRVGDNGEVSLQRVHPGAGQRFDLSAVRFRVADPQG